MTGEGEEWGSSGTSRKVGCQTRWFWAHANNLSQAAPITRQNL